MSQHLIRDIRIAYSPACDPKWRPENMKSNIFYPVYGYENGTIKLRPVAGAPASSGSIADALYFHFAGEGHKPCRLIASNAVVFLESVFADPNGEKKAIDEITSSVSSKPAGSPGDDPGF